jgi:hypothetical protein
MFYVCKEMNINISIGANLALQAFLVALNGAKLQQVSKYGPWLLRSIGSGLTQTMVQVRLGLLLLQPRSRRSMY